MTRDEPENDGPGLDIGSILTGSSGQSNKFSVLLARSPVASDTPPVIQ